MPTRTLLAATAALVLAAGASAIAQETQPKADAAPKTEAAPKAEAAPGDGVSLELNKLQPADNGCRAFLVVANPSATKFDKFQIDLVMFQTDGVIGSRFALELAPLLPAKRTIKEFVLTDTDCDRIGSFLVNDVIECRSEAGPVNDCPARLKVNSLTKVEISK